MSAPAVIVGGGLSGLTAAAQLALLDVSATLFDHATELGGRARTDCRNGFHLNYGPHRLYRSGAALRALEQLGVKVPSAVRGPNGGFAVRRGRKFTLPVGLCSLLTTGLLGPRAKRDLARLLASLGPVQLSDVERISIADWLRTSRLEDDVIQIVLALVRYSTYCDDPVRLSASAAIDQLRLSIRDDVLYVHHGWGELVDGLARAASRAGSVSVREQRVSAIHATNGRAGGVTLDDGTYVPAQAVIVATDPRTAKQLLSTTTTLGVPTDAVRVAALDIALRALPSPRTVFAIGIDEPWCFSADSVIARLAPGDGAVVHLAKYLPSGTSGAPADERQLEQAMDLLQPGWRLAVVHRRFLPTVTVSHAVLSADTGGFAGRPDGRVPGMANVFLAGDWVGPVGQLADAAVASGVSAARNAARFISQASGACGAR